MSKGGWTAPAPAVALGTQERASAGISLSSSFSSTKWGLGEQGQAEGGSYSVCCSRAKTKHRSGSAPRGAGPTEGAQLPRVAGRQCDFGGRLASSPGPGKREGKSDSKNGNSRASLCVLKLLFISCLLPQRIQGGSGARPWVRNPGVGAAARVAEPVACLWPLSVDLRGTLGPLRVQVGRFVLSWGRKEGRGMGGGGQGREDTPSPADQFCGPPLTFCSLLLRALPAPTSLVCGVLQAFPGSRPQCPKLEIIWAPRGSGRTTPRLHRPLVVACGTAALGPAHRPLGQQGHRDRGCRSVCRNAGWWAFLVSCHGFSLLLLFDAPSSDAVSASRMQGGASRRCLQVS